MSLLALGCQVSSGRRPDNRSRWKGRMIERERERTIAHGRWAEAPRPIHLDRRLSASSQQRCSMNFDAPLERVSPFHSHSNAFYTTVASFISVTLARWIVSPHSVVVVWTGWPLCSSRQPAVADTCRHGLVESRPRATSGGLGGLQSGNNKGSLGSGGGGRGAAAARWLRCLLNNALDSHERDARRASNRLSSWRCCCRCCFCCCCCCCLVSSSSNNNNSSALIGESA